MHSAAPCMAHACDQSLRPQTVCTVLQAGIYVNNYSNKLAVNGPAITTSKQQCAVGLCCIVLHMLSSQPLLLLFARQIPLHGRSMTACHR